MLRHLLVLPRARRWLVETTSANEAASRAISECDLDFLTRAFGTDLLASTRLVATEHVPQPPLEQWGIGGKDLFGSEAGGITLDHMIIVRCGLERNASLIFHELVHVVQWRTLGVNRFLALYGLLLVEHGYDNNPLEVMAYDLQARFDRGEAPVHTEAIVARRTREILAASRRRSMLWRTIFALLR